ncbi:hypothetical protein SCH01S_16_01310 [Sphingomonas changbaiensis NBRC 104936]|uniref:Uncharacterized protein n=1 Tax=Sphingomonas changbaiensis NBRC 104936 TaxID=1219043 RepID=A0A0E9MLF1_9SPHN|nr:hypothetical protein [Sphingomonas changbaiensis]GAO38612.1 hypothetical protein SCH01S_16_01310 [Sphingomonas changbaiensis NBRC 104936]
MANNNQSGQDRNQGGTTMADRASDLKDRAGELLQGGMDAVKNNPGTTAAVLGGVAAAAAAVMHKDKIVETAGALRDKVSGGSTDKTRDNA